MPLYQIKDRRPTIGEGAWIAPSAKLIGDVRIGKNCYIGWGAIVRGDYGTIINDSVNSPSGVAGILCIVPQVKIFRNCFEKGDRRQYRAVDVIIGQFINFRPYLCRGYG